MKIRQFFISHWKALVLLGSMLCLVLWPLARDGFFVSDDGEWMVIRLTAFFQSLREGQFPVRFLGRLNHNFGYPVSNFLYPGFLYAGSVLHAVGVPYVLTIKILLGGSVLGSSYFLYLWLRKQFSIFSSLSGVAGFLGVPYLFFDLYTRGSVGEIVALLPFFLGLAMIERGNSWLLALAIALLLISHNSLALLFMIVLLGYGVVRKRLSGLSVLIGIGMAAFFWIPALFETRFVRFAETIVANSREYFATSEALLMQGYGLLIVFLFVLIRGKKKRSLTKVYMLMLFVVPLIMASRISGPLWDISFVNSLFQFPFRFIAIWFAAAPWLVADWVEHASDKYRIVMLAAVVLFSALYLLSSGSQIEFTQKDEQFYATNEATTTVANEYMPVWVSDIPRSREDSRLIFISGRGEIEEISGLSVRIQAKITAHEHSTMQLNTVYYPGWGVLVDGVPVKLQYNNPKGLIQFSVPSGSHVIRAEFRETFFRFIADVISAISVVLWLVYGISMRKKP